MSSERRRRGPVGYADLFDALSAFESAADRTFAASTLGFLESKEPGGATAPSQRPALRIGSEEFEPEPPPTDPHSPVRFWRAVETEFQFPLDEEPIVQLRPPDPANTLKVADTGRDPGLEPKNFPLPNRLPLLPWSHLRRTMETVYRRPRPIGEVDVDALVRRISAAAELTQIPRLERPTSVRRLVVLLDRSWRLLPFWEDQIFVCRHLVREFGRARTGAEVVKAPPTWDEDELVLESFTESLCPGDVLLALSDLGVHSRVDGPAHRWARLGRALRLVGVSPVALMPCPVTRLPSRLTQAWRCIDWERPEAGLWMGADSQGHDEAVERLLALMSWHVRTEPDLLRELRVLLPGAGAAVEVAVWSHGEVETSRRGGMLEPGCRARAQLTLAKMIKEERELVEAAVEHVRRRHRWRPREIWAEELAMLESVAPGAELVTDDELDSTARFFARVRDAVELERCPGVVDGVDVAGWLERSITGGHARLGERTRKHPLFGQDLERIAELGFELRVRRGEAPPRDYHPGHLTPGGRREWRLRLSGDELKLADNDDVAAFCNPIASLEGHSNWIRVGEQDVEASQNSSWRLPQVGDQITVVTTGQTLALERVSRPGWANAMGCDEHGLWASFELGGAEQVMRWIPPGRFHMGSSESEEGRFGREGPQHPVTITRGFWMAETPCMQALWKAVMGNNPSRFEGLKRPVEQVSWDDVQQFLERLDEQTEPGFGLPTEAQWEYACRAGTKTARYGGLDEVAWHTGNSDEETHEVGQKQANALGLHDTLGNVYEWCSDWWSDEYEPGAVDDPQGPPSGRYRVVRGGGWFANARYVRAAFRSYAEPGNRDDDLGFRLVRGPGLRQPDERSESKTSKDEQARARDEPGGRPASPRKKGGR